MKYHHVMDSSIIVIIVVGVFIDRAGFCSGMDETRRFGRWIAVHFALEESTPLQNGRHGFAYWLISRSMWQSLFAIVVTMFMDWSWRNAHCVVLWNRFWRPQRKCRGLIPIWIRLGWTGDVFSLINHRNWQNYVEIASREAGHSNLDVEHWALCFCR